MDDLDPPTVPTPPLEPVADSDISESASISDSSRGLPEAAADAAHLSQLRSQWHDIAQIPAKEGEERILIDAEYLNQALTSDAEALASLQASLGKIPAVIDQPDFDATNTAHVALALYNLLDETFGHVGTPVTRVARVDSAGNITLERPPYFVVHVLGKRNQTNHYNANAGHNAAVAAKYRFFLSSRSTFGDLIATIRSRLNATRPIRVWFVSGENVDALPQTLTVQTFIHKLALRKVVCGDMENRTLESEGIGGNARLHVAVEAKELAALQFPLDTALVAVPEPADVLHSGGHSGLANLGNTCYMNLALQCLVHLQEVNLYFFFGLHERELNKTNPLGFKGDIASAFSNLLHKLFDSAPTAPAVLASSSVTPREFKYTVGRYLSMFQGYQQQDSQEFLSWLLDALHEDLNRIYDKPYLEKPELLDEDVNNDAAIAELAAKCWSQHKQRNDSIIVDLFSGLYQSTLVCPTCGKKSVTFDPYNDITLPLPVNKNWYHEFVVVDVTGSMLPLPIMKLEVELAKTANIDDLVLYLSSFLRVTREYLFIYELFRNYFYRDLTDLDSKYKFLPVSELISTGDQVVVYIVPHKPQDVIFPVVNVAADADKSYNVVLPFGIPMFALIDRDSLSEYDVVQEKVMAVLMLLTKKKEPAAPDNLNDEADIQIPVVKTMDMEDTESVLGSARESNSEKEDMEIQGSGTPAPNAETSFALKFFKDERSRSRQNDARSPIHIPTGRQPLTNLPLLSEMYKDRVSSDESYVVVSPSSAEPKEEESSLGPNVRNLDEESDCNWDNMRPLLGSIDRLGSPTVSILDSERDMSDPQNLPDLASPDLDKRVMFVVEWTAEAHELLFGEPENQAWENLTKLPNEQLEASKRQLALRQKAKISLYDCLKTFSSPEILGEQDLWYCPRCKDHKRATKTIQIWSTGDILTIHLKRFLSARSFSDKINMVVEFPIEGLDMSEYVASDDNLLYDLVAVDNHYGGLGGGHYTAAAKNFRDNRWYYFNDSRVTPIDDSKEVITAAAYLLFYKRRTGHLTAGGDNVEKLLEEGRRQFELKLSQTKQRQDEVRAEIDLYNLHEDQGEDSEKAEDVDDHGDLYDDETAAPGKKSRSPLTEQSQKFDNQRKQRLISKDADLPRSVNINMGYSSSTSNLESPTISSDEDASGSDV